MRFPLEWSAAALNSAAGFLTDDADGLQQLIDAIDQLSDEPRPSASTALGAAGLRRLHVGRYRALYEFIEDAATIAIIHIGRTG